MLGVSLDLSPVGIHKGLGVTQALLEERLELVPRDRDKSICVISPPILLPAEPDPIQEDGHSKENLGKPHSSSGSKVVFTLLIEIIAVYIRLPAVYVRRTGL